MCVCVCVSVRVAALNIETLAAGVVDCQESRRSRRCTKIEIPDDRRPTTRRVAVPFASYFRSSPRFPFVFLFAFFFSAASRRPSPKKVKTETAFRVVGVDRVLIDFLPWIKVDIGFDFIGFSFFFVCV